MSERLPDVDRFMMFEADPAKRTNPKAPDFKACFVHEGEVLEIACWWKEGDSPRGHWRALSGTIKPKQEQAPRSAPRPPQHPAPPTGDDVDPNW